MEPRFIVVKVIGPHEHTEEELERMAETEALVTTFGGVVVKKTVQHRAAPEPATFVGSGKLEQLKGMVKEYQAGFILIDGIVKPSQLFRVERFLWEAASKVQVWDRMDLILGIFAKHASSRVAKLQIELAWLGHQGPRIYGLGGRELSGQRGGIGQRGGAGETNIELEKRRMKTRQAMIREQLNKLAQDKKARFRYRREQGFGPVALVGYTSAGKTTLFNRLTGKEKQTDPRLFTTLDTVVGKMKTEAGRMPVLISDTIGFIADLPVQLVEAFKSTLMEALEARLVLHVIDAADTKREEKAAVVEQILAELNMTQPVIRVYNKADLASKKDRSDGVWLSAKTGQGVDSLKVLIWKALVGGECGQGEVGDWGS